MGIIYLTPVQQPAVSVSVKLTKVQRRALIWARRKYEDGRVPPYMFRDYRTVSKLLEAGFIEPWIGYGAPMYKFTHQGLDVLERES
jgi:hypothetical protein